MPVSAKGIVTPDNGDGYDLVVDLAEMANSIDGLISAVRGTAAQRTAATASSPSGTLWQDTDGIKMIWRKDGAAWVPAVWRWSGTTTQMNAFTQAPNGFAWYNTTDNNQYLRSGGAWVSTARKRGIATGSSGALTAIGTTGNYGSSPTFRVVGVTAGPNEKFIWGADGVGTGFSFISPVSAAVSGSDTLLTCRFVQIGNQAQQSISIWWEIVPQ